jgi:predicted ATPase
MSSPEKLGTGYGIARKRVQEYDLSGLEPHAIGHARSQLSLVDAAGLQLQPQDVGVGISQVLPVVVAAQDINASVVCIEQPELHIHPSVQVGLGDLFIDGALNNGLSFLIETHSEHLIMRLQRRIRETSRGELPDHQSSVEATDVNVICVGRDETGVAFATSIALDEDGKFLDRWPTGFFPERMREALPKEVRDKIRAARPVER